MGFAVAAWNLFYKHRIPTGFSRQTPKQGVNESYLQILRSLKLI